MTTTADDAAVEGAFEAYLAGRPVPEGAAGLAAFADAVRATATRPGRPSAALADLLSTGLLTDLSSPPAPVARSAGRPAAARDRRRRLRMLLPALFAKFAAAGAIAQAAAVGGVAVVGLSTAGFTGVLPTPVQHGFATVVDTVTPFQAPDPQKTADPVTPPSPSDTAVPTAGTDGQNGADAPETSAPAHPSNFGGAVSSQAHDGGVDGQSISEQAHARNEARKHGDQAAVAPQTAEPSASGGDGSSATDGGTASTGHGAAGHGSGHDAGHH